MINWNLFLECKNGSIFFFTTLTGQRGKNNYPDEEKAFDKFNTFHNKSTQQTRNRRKLPQYNEDHV